MAVSSPLLPPQNRTRTMRLPERLTGPALLSGGLPHAE